MTVQQVGQITQDTGVSRFDIDSRTRAWRRQLGALAWAALEDLALAAHPSDQGWVAPVGVRDPTKELMARIGHASPRAALIYQHATTERDRQIADYLDAQIAEAEVAANEVHRAPIKPLRSAPDSR